MCKKATRRSAGHRRLRRVAAPLLQPRLANTDKDASTSRTPVPPLAAAAAFVAGMERGGEDKIF